MSLQRTPPRGTQKKSVKGKLQMEEEGPTEASASVTTMAQADPPKKTKLKKSEMEDLKTFLAAEMKTFGEIFQKVLDTFKVDFKAEMHATVQQNDNWTDLEGRQRRKNLRIVGVKEGSEREMGTRDFVADLLQKALKLDHKPLLGRAHRAQRRRTQDDAHPRQIIVKVQQDHEFDDIMKKIVRSSQLLFEGVRFSIYRDYPAEVFKKRVLFTETKRILKNVPDLRYSLLYPARLRVTYKSKELFFTDHEKALEYAKEVGNMTTD